MPPRNCPLAFCVTLPPRSRRSQKHSAGTATASMLRQGLNKCCASCFRKNLNYCCRRATTLEKHCLAPRAIYCLQDTTACCWSTAIVQHYLRNSWCKQLKRCATLAIGWYLGQRAMAVTTSSV